MTLALAVVLLAVGALVGACGVLVAATALDRRHTAEWLTWLDTALDDGRTPR